MARLIKSSGEVTVVKPTNKKFTLEELQKFVGGYIEQLNVGEKIWFCNEEGLIHKLPENIRASELLLFALGSPVQILVGDVIICDPSEVE